MGEIKLQINPKNRPAVPAVNWQQARVLEMQEEYAAAFDTSLVNTIEEMRAAYNEERKMWNTGGPVMAETVDFDVPYEGDKVPVRLLRPVKAEKLPVIFFMHGGGFVEGNNDTHSMAQRKLAAYSGCVVIGIDYSLAPEIKYPRSKNVLQYAIMYQSMRMNMELTRRKLDLQEIPAEQIWRWESACV